MIRFLVGLVAASLLVACDSDPGKGKAKAQVGSAAPAASVGDVTSVGAYKIDASSKVEFVGANPTTKHPGGFKKFKGSVKLEGDKVEQGSVAIEIDMTSVFTDDEELTTHLKSKDFYEVEKFPTAKFVSTKVEKGGSDGATHTITGNLTIKEKTKSISFPAKVKVEGATRSRSTRTSRSSARTSASTTRAPPTR